MLWTKLVVSTLWTAGLWVTGAAQTPARTRWCAEPRPDEPLLRAAQGLRDPADTGWATTRYVFKIPLLPDANITVIGDETICRELAEIYADHIRSVGDPGWAARPVLVVRLGSMYLVDDPSSGDGYWTVLLLDSKWQILYTYGGGS
jgi:hypothetical protein